MKKIIVFLSSTLFQNIIALATFMITLVFGCLTVKEYSSAESNVGFHVNPWALLTIISFSIFFALFIISIARNKKQMKHYEIVQILIDLQNKYLFSSTYTTAGEHAKISKEKDLRTDGKAYILTNSLSYDYNFCGEIAANIKDGANYVYLLPKTDRVFNELGTFIIELHQKLTEKNQQNETYAAEVEKIVKETLTEKVKVIFFDKEILCLYNFACFVQEGHKGFSQSWWYINPTVNKPNDDSEMLTHVIDDDNDKEKLKKAIDLLMIKKQEVSGYEIYQNHSDLENKYGAR